MSNRTPKPLSDQDADQTLKYAFNDVDATFSTNGFLVGEVGRQITQAITETTVPGDTSIYSFYDPIGTLLYQYTIVYTDSTQSTLISATRTA
jgi:hypothetical protein